MRELITAFIIVFTLQIATNKPALPEVQAQETKRIEAPRVKEKKKTIKHATKDKKVTRKPTQLPENKPQPIVIPTGSCSNWIRAAGISDVASATELIRRESGCNANAINPSSGACGVAQELPCGKSGCSLGDGACQVKWMNQYVASRYGSWSGAISFHNANNWY
mgnify:CR=1 FL=1